MGQDYYLGLDMGTSSVGWAVTDSSYNLMRRKGKDMWGVRLFPEANTAAARRTSRTARRRLQRQRARIGMLRELFQEEIDKVDSSFYQRLSESKYWEEDKTIQQKNTLFNDDSFTDKEYYDKYKTIFHLRKELLYSTEPHDVRLVFLAVLNIFKHRGHFLNANISSGDGMEDITGILEDLNECYKEYTGEIYCDLDSFIQIKEELISNDYSPSKKCEVIAEKIGIARKDKSKYEILKAMCGLTATVATMFPKAEGEENYDDETRKLKVSFKSADLDEILTQIETVVDESAFEVILVIGRICSWASVASVMKGGNIKYLSEARIAMYEKHQTDLKLLKKVYRLYAPELYNKMFRMMEKGSYSEYVGSVNSSLEKMRRNKNKKANSNRNDDFIDTVKKDVLKMEQNEETNYILSEIDKQTFLPKQLSADNGSIPYQLHSNEIKKILQNASVYLPFLNKVDETKLSVAEKIVQLFEFKIPYFVGPLRNTQNGTGWSEVMEKGRITPWNIKEKIDFDKSEEQFILNLIRHCTYLSDEYVLPRESLLYQKFCVLNELNNLKIDGDKPSVELKQKIYNDLFKKGKKVKGNALRKYLEKEGVIEKNANPDLSGFDEELNGDFMNTLSSYKKFAEAFGVERLTDEQERIAEDIIKMLTIHSGEKKVIQEKLSKKYGEDSCQDGIKLTKQQIDRISGYRMKDWGNLSKEFLQLQGYEDGVTIIERMWNTNNNMMELLHGDYGFKEKLDEKCNNAEKTLSEIKYEDLDGLYLSSPVKRMVWQTILILKEIENVMGCEPKKVFVEMTRGGDSKQGRTTSRQKRLLGLYMSCKKEEPVLFEQIQKETDSSMRIKKLYLYYMQKGKCMYTGETIHIADLMNDNLYDIDHIYPRHFRKDDSLENNLVLVKKNINNRKQDTYPIESGIRSKMYTFWESLYDGGFINKIKFERLKRSTDFTPDEKAEFIARQIVETSQGTKAVANLIGKLFIDSKIVYVKASTVSDFRKDKDIIKVRSINDLHHANDAYLNIVVGNVYNVKFTSDPRNFIKEYQRNPDNHKYHMYHMFDYDVIRGDEVAWTIGKNSSISIVRNTIKRGTPIVTYMNYEAHGAITRKDTVYSCKIAKNETYMPLSVKDEKLRNVEKYGGRSDIVGSYFFLVEHTVKGKRVRTIEPMYLYLVDKMKTKEDIEQYCRENLHYEAPSVRVTKIKMYSKIRVNGYEVYLTGRSLELLIISNAFQLKLNYEDTKYIKLVESACDKSYTDEQLRVNNMTKERNLEIYDILINKHLNGIFSKKPNSIGGKLQIHREDFKMLSIENQFTILIEIINATLKKNSGSNFKIINESVSSGKMTLNKKISDNKEFVLINQSPTGLYESRVNLLTV